MCDGGYQLASLHHAHRWEPHPIFTPEVESQVRLVPDRLGRLEICLFFHGAAGGSPICEIYDPCNRIRTKWIQMGEMKLFCLALRACSWTTLVAGVYFTFGSCATPFLLAASVGLAPLFAKLLSALQKRLKCPKWLAFFLLGVLMAACYVMALPLLITLACVALHQPVLK